MRNLKTILLIMLLLTAILSLLLMVPSLFDEPEIEISGYSPISVNPSVQNVSEPSDITKPSGLDSYEYTIKTILENADNFSFAGSFTVDRAFIDKLNEICGREVVESFATALENGVVTSDDFKKVTGYSVKAFEMIALGSLERTSIIENTEDGVSEFIFVGDTAFPNGYSVMNKYLSRGKGVEGLVSEEVLGMLRSADVTMANNEFTLTDRGSPIPGKIWTFRGKPENVSIFHELGVDIVGLANNHAFDYGPLSLTDTLATLDGAGIARLGAGEDINEAKAPYYYIINGYVVAIVAGSAIDPYSTRGATESQSGVFQIFDTVSMSKEIKNAKENADYVVAYVHWGRENTTVLTSGQKSMGRAFVDAGADVVIGMHSHCMQGLEYYNGKLIVYSLGNFIFSSHNLTCGMLKFSIGNDGTITNTFYPMMQKDNFTYINSGEDGEKQFESLKSLSSNVEFTDDYIVTEKK